MINFMDPQYNNDQLYFRQNSDWIVILHFKAYTTMLEDIDAWVLGKIGAYDSILPSDCNYSTTFWDSLKKDFEDNPLSQMVTKLTEEILRCDSCLNGEENPRGVYDPTIGKVDGVFAKLIASLDKGVGNFLQNYSMAKQVSKFECDFMEIFRQVQEIQAAIKRGEIMKYFDSIYKEIRKDFENFRFYSEYNNYLNVSDLSCNTKTNMSYAYFNSYIVPDMGQSNVPVGKVLPFSTCISNYRTKLEIGLRDLNTLLDAMDGFMDEIYIAIKVLGALNIVFYADPADQDLLVKESNDTFEAMTPPIGQDTDSENAKASLQIRTIWAMAAAVPIAIEAQKYIDDRRTNQATIFGSTVNATFYSIGLSRDLEILRDVLEQQHN